MPGWDWGCMCNVYDERASGTIVLLSTMATIILVDELHKYAGSAVKK